MPNNKLRALGVALVVAAAAIASALPGPVGVSAAAAGPAGRLVRAQQTQLLPMQWFTLKGSFRGKAGARVRLYRQSGSGWATVASTRAGSRGRFSFRGVRTPATRVYRAQTGRLRSNTVKVAVGQSAALRFTSDGDSRVGVATFTPNTPGRKVQLHRRVDGGRWYLLGSRKQNRQGKVRFSVPTAEAAKYEYRVRGMRWAGAGTVESPASWSSEHAGLSVGGRSYVLPGERFTMTGHLPVPTGTTVTLFREGAGGWEPAASASVGGGGVFSVGPLPPGGGVFLARAGGEQTLPARVEVREQSAQLTVAAVPLAQPGGTPAAADSASRLVTGTFTPATAGRVAVLQRRLPGGSWGDVGHAQQSAGGHAWFHIAGTADAARYDYRVLGAPLNGSAEVVSAGAGVPSGSWALDFDDEFSGTALNTWWAHRQTTYGVNPGRKRSKASPDMVKVEGGTVQLRAAVDRATTSSTGVTHYLNGHIATERSARPYTFRHGVAAARIKFTEDRGQHGGFWMQSAAPSVVNGNPWVSGAEIDVVENFGRGQTASNVYYFNSSGTKTKLGGVVKPMPEPFTHPDWWRGYHVYSVEWTPSGYVFRVDGVETFRTSEGVSGAEEFLILSLLTSDWEIPLIDHSKLPARIDVDWVRVWQQR